MSRIGFSTERLNHRLLQINLKGTTHKPSDIRELSKQRENVKRSTSKDAGASVNLYHSIIELEMKWKSIKNDMDSRENSVDRNSSCRKRSLEKCKTSCSQLTDIRSKGDRSMIIPKTVPISSITLEKKKGGTREMRSQSKVSQGSPLDTPQRSSRFLNLGQRKKWAANRGNNVKPGGNDSKLKKSSYVCYPHKENFTKVSLSKPTTNPPTKATSKSIRVQLMPCHKDPTNKSSLPF